MDGRCFGRLLDGMSDRLSSVHDKDVARVLIVDKYAWGVPVQVRTMVFTGEDERGHFPVE